MDVPHESLQAGDPCPQCAKGTVYANPAGVLIRFTGRTKYFLSAFGEHLICEEVSKAIVDAAQETGGLPADLHDRYADRFLTMPIASPRVRSLNLSTSVGIAVYEALRQIEAQ